MLYNKLNESTASLLVFSISIFVFQIFWRNGWKKSRISTSPSKRIVFSDEINFPLMGHFQFLGGVLAHFIVDVIVFFSAYGNEVFDPIAPQIPVWRSKWSSAHLFCFDMVDVVCERSAQLRKNDVLLRYIEKLPIDSTIVFHSISPMEFFIAMRSLCLSSLLCSLFRRDFVFDGTLDPIPWNSEKSQFLVYFGFIPHKK